MIEDHHNNISSVALCGVGSSKRWRSPEVCLIDERARFAPWIFHCLFEFFRFVCFGEFRRFQSADLKDDFCGGGRQLDCDELLRCDQWRTKLTIAITVIVLTFRNRLELTDSQCEDDSVSCFRGLVEIRCGINLWPEGLHKVSFPSVILSFDLLPADGEWRSPCHWRTMCFSRKLCLGNSFRFR